MKKLLLLLLMFFTSLQIWSDENIITLSRSPYGEKGQGEVVVSHPRSPQCPIRIVQDGHNLSVPSYLECSLLLLIDEAGNCVYSIYVLHDEVYIPKSIEGDFFISVTLSDQSQYLGNISL